MSGQVGESRTLDEMTDVPGAMCLCVVLLVIRSGHLIMRFKTLMQWIIVYLSYVLGLLRMSIYFILFNYLVFLFCCICLHR